MCVYEVSGKETRDSYMVGTLSEFDWTILPTNETRGILNSLEWLFGNGASPAHASSFSYIL